GVRFPPDACGLKWYTTAKRAWTCSDIPTPPQHGHRIANLARPLAEFFRGEREPIATAEDARISLRMVLACYVSVREGRRVHIDDPRIDSV
ncbi:MAG: hypothetical protein QHJ73_09300, partial [Armatimonadota bacterium]|nr:hypothetical protein [Armatimonadota bacterium]